MSDQHTYQTRSMGTHWATVSARTAAVLRERRLQIALDSNGHHRITMA
ncbi:MAG: hypothetical protein GY812_14960 [Actinomycetia bacterium]|nr:hypothetical protein [Actinomycetes bacterium]